MEDRSITTIIYLNMPFSKFHLKNFKCFHSEQILRFAIPDNEKEGSGITYIVGTNNSGKTTIIEALAIKKGTKLKSSERVVTELPEFKLYEGENLRRYCKLIRVESSTIEEDPALAESELFEIISSRRHWNSNANSDLYQSGQTFRNSLAFVGRQTNIDVGSELKKIESDNIKYNEFIALVQRVIPEFTKFAVGYEDNEFIEYISRNGRRHKSDFLGDGVITVIRILLQLYINRGCALIIDEPELSLHPSAQKKLLNILGEFSKTRQIIISTHSPYFIRWEYLENGAVINRIVKHNDIDSQIFSLDNFEEYSSLISGANWKQPFLLDEVAKEILFAEDNILFLEGQEDVGLLRIEPDLSNANIFGYGVRGKDNFKFALKLAQALGFTKVACILDSGSAELEIKNELTSIFPNYKIVQWNRADIRDKGQITTKEKIGYYTKDGVKKSDLDDFNTKLTEIKNYFT